MAPGREARTAIAAAAVALGLLVGSFLFVSLRGGASSVPDDRLVLAVIPAGTTDGPDGSIAESVTRELSRIDPTILGVVGPASLGRRTEGRIEPLAVGSTVGAHLVLVIEVVEAQPRASVRVTLREVEDGASLWTQTYEDDLRDVRGIARTITADALEALSLVLPGPS